ncbi:peptide chain release factor N(5)-glutamine methyltransferase [Pelotomaculum propionicicum]|uniref:peptide chain release factor N(5)-glutamine methyltransferase n=1 Tax=Pelotomaculum propionicicum TaxID=258475 RepID=UPI003B78A2BD
MAGTIKSALKAAREKFNSRGIGSAALDAEVLLSHVTGLERAELYRDWDRPLRDDEAVQYNNFTSRRLSGEPVAYITGHKEFMGLNFFVNSSVLIPRPETELLVENALKVMPPFPLVIDVGTGSGAIGVSLAYFNREALVYATDRSTEALEVARLNSTRHGVSGRVLLHPGDLIQPLHGCLAAGGVDLIAANLPYIAENDLSGLPGEVSMFEPRLALDGGKDGLEHYRRLVPEAAAFLKKGGFLLIEIGFDQGRQAQALFDPQVWETKVRQDLAGLDRLVAARLRREK